MSEFFEIPCLKWGPIQYELKVYNQFFGMENRIVENYAIKMIEHEVPISIRKDEFEFLKNIIKKYDLKSGFELATAFGVSTVALGLGFKETNGKLLTMDAYVEERQLAYTQEYSDTSVNFNSDGFKSVNYLIEHFRLKDIVNPQIGWSPDDVHHIINNHSKKSFDFVFLDGGHTPKQVIKDLFAIRPFLEDEYVIVLHDYFDNVFDEEVLFFMDNFLKMSRPIIELKQPFGDNMSVIYNKKI